MILVLNLSFIVSTNASIGIKMIVCTVTTFLIYISVNNFKKIARILTLEKLRQMFHPSMPSYHSEPVQDVYVRQVLVSNNIRYIWPQTSWQCEAKALNCWYFTKVPDYSFLMWESAADVRNDDFREGAAVTNLVPKCLNKDRKSYGTPNLQAVEFYFRFFSASSRIWRPITVNWGIHSRGSCLMVGGNKRSR